METPRIRRVVGWSSAGGFSLASAGFLLDAAGIDPRDERLLWMSAASLGLAGVLAVAHAVRRESGRVATLPHLAELDDVCLRCGGHRRLACCHCECAAPATTERWEFSCHSPAQTVAQVAALSALAMTCARSLVAVLSLDDAPWSIAAVLLLAVLALLSRIVHVAIAARPPWTLHRMSRATGCYEHVVVALVGDSVRAEGWSVLEWRAGLLGVTEVPRMPAWAEGFAGAVAQWTRGARAALVFHREVIWARDASAETSRAPSAYRVAGHSDGVRRTTRDAWWLACAGDDLVTLFEALLSASASRRGSTAPPESRGVSVHLDRIVARMRVDEALRRACSRHEPLRADEHTHRARAAVFATLTPAERGATPGPSDNER